MVQIGWAPCYSFHMPRPCTVNKKILYPPHHHHHQAAMATSMFQEAHCHPKQVVPKLGISADQKMFPQIGPKSTVPGPFTQPRTWRCRLPGLLSIRMFGTERTTGAFSQVAPPPGKLAKEVSQGKFSLFVCLFSLFFLSFPFYITHI